MLIQTYEDMKHPRVQSEISIETYVSLIKGGYEVDDILYARAKGKGHSIYDAIKESRMCFTFNFLFDQTKKNQNITGATGLLYFDIDQESFDIGDLDVSKVFMLHKSFGGKGWSIIVQVDGLTLDNFKASYLSISSELGIHNDNDKGARKPTQYTVCSYDPDIFYNPLSYSFTAVAACKKVSSSGIKKKEKNIPVDDTFSSEGMRLTNVLDFVGKESDYTVFPDGQETIKLFMRKHVEDGSRQHYLLMFCSGLVILNPNKPMHEVYNFMRRVAEIAGIDTNKLENVVTTIFRYKKEGTLVFLNNKVRKIGFNSNSRLTKEEKNSIVGKELGKMKSDKTRAEIITCIQNWDSEEKITAKCIALRIDKSHVTVKRHYPHIKYLIKK